MTINRRRAPSSQISSQKKLSGHSKEQIYAELIGAIVIKGTQKGDIKDKNGLLHSVKSGKKWQVFLYGYNRIAESINLNILKKCLDAFPEKYHDYLKDREKCIGYKEKFIKDYGRDAAKRLSNEEVSKSIGSNLYVNSKIKLEKATLDVCELLKDKKILRSFLDEAFFDNGKVNFLAIEDSTYKNDGIFKVFSREDVLNIFTQKLTPAVSIAGLVPEDFNISGQKTLLRYQKKDGKLKNIVEIEVRNDSDTHYRQARFNMYSKDALTLLLEKPDISSGKKMFANVIAYGKAAKEFEI